MMRKESEPSVSVARDARAVDYPTPPCDPPERYAELTGPAGPSGTDPFNRVYPLVRESLALLGLDSVRFGTSEWSPFRGLVKKGESVTLKPNLVFHDHPLGPEGTRSMITHAAVLRPLIDYLLLETGGEVRITIADAPLQSADWATLIERNGLAALVEHYQSRGVPIVLADLRREVALLDEEGLIVDRRPGSQDPKGYTVVDLGRRSAFHPVRNLADRFEITDYPRGSVARHHHDDKNEYLIGTSVLDCDLFINVPKLKTHKKAGITGALKNLIGINGDKSWIAHHRSGSRRQGGDEYDVLRPLNYAMWHFNAALKRSTTGIALNRLLRKLYRRVVLRGKSHKQAVLEGSGALMVMEGSWIGNDTLWRTILDLNTIVLFADRQGRIHDEPQRRYLGVVDAVLCGEKNGPMEQIPRPAGMILAGFNPVALDSVGAAIMGFDPHLLPQIAHGYRNEFFPLCPFLPDEIRLHPSRQFSENPPVPFQPPHGWEKMVVDASVPLADRIAGLREDMTVAAAGPSG